MKQFNVIMVFSSVLALVLGGLIALVPGSELEISLNTKSNQSDSDLAVTDLLERDSFVPAPTVLGVNTDAAITHQYAFVDSPLQPKDYYGGKYTNAKAGANEINSMPVLRVGERHSLLRSRIITLKGSKGYVQSDLEYFASGVCWTVSVFGYLMDVANTQFRQKYGIDMFVFPQGRSPHGKKYDTYRFINGGRGYTIFNSPDPKRHVDYTFGLNPQITEIEQLKDLQVKIVMTATSSSGKAYRGQSIGGYVLTNKDFLLYQYSEQDLGPLWQKITNQLI